MQDRAVLDPRANFRHVNSCLDQRLAGIEDVIDGRIAVTVDREVPAFPGPLQSGGGQFLGRHVGQPPVILGAEIGLQGLVRRLSSVLLLSICRADL